MVQSRAAWRSGRFWLAGEPEQAVGGWLDVSDRWPLVELVEPLTAAMREVSRTQQPDGSYVASYEPADDDVQPDTVTVHGVLRDGPRRVTLVEASTAGRKQMLGGGIPDPGMEQLRGSYALLGGHVAGGGTRFRHARLRFQHLDVWAQLPGVELEVAGDRSRAVLTQEQPDEESVQLHNPAGRLVLDSSVVLTQPTVRGGRLGRTAELRWDSNGAGLTVNEAYSEHSLKKCSARTAWKAVR